MINIINISSQQQTSYLIYIIFVKLFYYQIIITSGHIYFHLRTRHITIEHTYTQLTSKYRACATHVHTAAAARACMTFVWYAGKYWLSLCAYVCQPRGIIRNYPPPLNAIKNIALRYARESSVTAGAPPQVYYTMELLLHHPERLTAWSLPLRHQTFHQAAIGDKENCTCLLLLHYFDNSTTTKK